MTDKIIIDGVDVSECGFFHPEYKNTDCHIALAFSEEYGGCTKCEQNPNCYYKQLKRKEQECEELKETIRAYQEDRFCQGGCAIYQYDKIHKLTQALEEKEQECKMYKNSFEETSAFNKELIRDKVQISFKRNRYQQALNEIERIASKKRYFDTTNINALVKQINVVSVDFNNISIIINKAKEQ